MYHSMKEREGEGEMCRLVVVTTRISASVTFSFHIRVGCTSES